MNKISQELKFTIASDVAARDGIGIEIYVSDELVLEIFRDDSKKMREVTLHQKDVPLEVIENSISLFKEKIAWEFVE